MTDTQVSIEQNVKVGPVGHIMVMSQADLQSHLCVVMRGPFFFLVMFRFLK